MSRILPWLGMFVFCFISGWVSPPCFENIAAAQESAALTKAAPVADQKKAEKDHPDDEWSVIYMGKIRVGSSRSNSKTIVRDGQKLIRSESQSMMLIKRFGQSLKMNITMVSEETEGGDFIGLEFRNDNPPNSFSKTIGTVVGADLQLRIESAGKTTKKTVKWDRENKSPAYQDRIMRENPLKPGESRDFKMFLPELNQVTKVTLKEMGEEDVKLLDGSNKKLKRIDISQSVLPGFVTKTWMDAKGETLKTSTPGFFGSDMATYRVTRDEALKEIVGAELDIAVDTLIKINPPLERAHHTQQVVYLVKISGSDPAKEIPSGETQQIKSVGPETAELTVTSVRPTAGAAASDKKPAPEFLEPNRHLQSDDKRVIAHADAAAAGATSPWDIALQMEKYVHQKLTKKNFSTALASAAEVAASMEGDCTEHACLLAAMCRVKKIPSRVVVGLVYADHYNAFGGHMWTEVFINGHWIPLDATLGAGGIGAAHIKLNDTSFSDDGPNPTTGFLPILKIIGYTTIQIKTVKYQP
ncbi:MAG: hypothetical protein JWM11_6211 [Planctomycetaceae bacterium]|nr:hypothetical protein [Planctomycetaceae bacterium]